MRTAYISSNYAKNAIPLSFAPKWRYAQYGT